MSKVDKLHAPNEVQIRQSVMFAPRHRSRSVITEHWPLVLALALGVVIIVVGFARVW